MVTLKGKIDDKHGIKIYILPNGKYITNFVLNSDGKSCPVFFNEKLTLACSTTVEVKGDFPSLDKAKVYSEEEKQVSLREQVIAEAIRRINAENRAFSVKMETSELQAQYLEATEVLDCAQNILYSISKLPTKT